MTRDVERVAVLGAGSWGTVYAKVLGDAGREVMVWSRRESVADMITTKHANPGYLPGVSLPRSVSASVRLDEVVAGADVVAVALPSQALREALTIVRDELPPGVPVLSLVKGVEVGTGLRMSELIAAVGKVPAERVAVLSGPNLAAEIAERQPATTLVACPDLDVAEAIASASTTSYFRAFTATDVIGAEIGGTGKNIIALAVGLADGLGLGGNTTASIMTRGLAEIARLGVALGGRAETFSGLSGLGDLVATCSSPLSRNRSLGRRLGAGLSFDDAVAAGSGQVAEGVTSVRSLRDLAARHEVAMPITETIYRVCYHHAPPDEVVSVLVAGHGE